MKKMLILLWASLFILLTLTACGTDNTEEVTEENDDGEVMEYTAVDYGEESNWLALPEDPDAYDVDVFYVYPTIYQGMGLQDITDPDQVEASLVPVRTQASVFAESANIYVPMYRQVGREGFGDTENLEDNLAVGESDVEASLMYYLENYNHGKPFIIAGHSQGSSTLMSLLTKIWGTTGAEDRMIATYIIGFSVTASDMEANSNIRMCEGPTDYGCFISYNSMKDGMQSQSIQILDGAVVTNPLSWISSTGEGAYVDATENLGAVFFNDEGYEPVTYENFTSAQVKEEGLVCEVADTSVLSAYDVEGIYHPDDYSLFYNNIKENIVQRIDAYFTDME
jgi:hypothetical protein